VLNSRAVRDDVSASSARLRWAAAGGAALWCLLLAGGAFAAVGPALVALAVACVVPLGCALVAEPEGPRVEVWAAWAVPLAAPMAIGSFLLAPGPAAAALAAPWLAAAVLVALGGLRRLCLRGFGPLEETSLDLGRVYLPVGAAWLLASRAGASPMGFHEPVVLYTAAHFHYAGFAAPLVLGLLGRDAPAPRGQVYAVTAAVVLAGVPLVAVGITVSRAFEAPAAVLLGAGMWSAAALCLRAGVAAVRAHAWRRGALLGVAGLSLVLSMGFAVAFALTGSAGRAAPGGRISFNTMAAVHGAANALGFALCALAAFTLRPPPRRHPTPAPSRPRRFAAGFVGVDFFDRTGALDPARAVAGQLDALDDFAHAGFDPARVAPSVRDFYERTGRFSLRVTPRWHRPFGLPAAVFHHVARRLLGQLVLPIAPEGDATVRTRLCALRDDGDGRLRPRAYVRSYAEGADARPNYVADYATHRGAAHDYLSCAFPLPFCALLGVLRFEQGARAGGLSLTSEAPPAGVADDAGMFLVTRVGALRLPLSERIDVWPEGEALRAEHRVRLFGLRCVTLTYALTEATPRLCGPDEGP